MNIPIDIAVDIRNYLHLFGEHGRDVAALRARLDKLEAELPKELRAHDCRWTALEKDILELDRQLDSGEPSTLEAIHAARPTRRHDTPARPAPAVITDKIAGGWHGRIAGCILGKPVECLMREQDSRAALRRILSAAGEYPLRDFIPEAVMLPYWHERFGKQLPRWFQLGHGRQSLRGHIAFAPSDDDLNYTVVGLRILQEHGDQFTPDTVLDTWLACLPYEAVATAERAAYRNRVLGMAYPETAVWLNPYREWIGAQIRADAYGYVCPGDPERAARLAWQDAAASHVGNGIYGAMWTAAAIAAAFNEDDPETVIRRGLEQVPDQSRFAVHMRMTIAAARQNGTNFEQTFDDIQRRLGHYHCVHTINNACVVAAALLHGGHDFGRIITIAVMGGLDTDCNGATAGSIAGVMLGRGAIPGAWTEPFNDTLHTAIAGRNVVRISDLVSETVDLARPPT